MLPTYVRGPREQPILTYEAIDELLVRAAAAQAERLALERRMTGRAAPADPPAHRMTVDEFLSAEARLRAIDRHELEGVRAFAPHQTERWLDWRRDPIRFLRTADDELRARIWALVQG